jgi:hypothetical protein
VPVHNPVNFNDAILPMAPPRLAGLVEKKMPRFAG